MQKMAWWLKQLEELNKKLTIDEMDQDKAHKKELDKRDKDREKELSNFHKKQQGQKHIVEVLKVVEAMKEIKEDKEFYKKCFKKIKENKEFYKKCLKEEQESREKQEKQLAEMMHGLVVVAQQEKMKYEILMQEKESQHAKEIEYIQKVHADQAKLREEECNMMTAEILTPKEKQQENSKKQRENSKKLQEHHQTMMDAEEHNVALMQYNKSVEAVAALVTIRERSTTFNDLQVNVHNLKDKHKNSLPINKQKPTMKNEKTTVKQEKHKKQEKYKIDKERKSKIPSKEVHYDSLTYNAWDKKRWNKFNCADLFQFDAWYKK